MDNSSNYNSSELKVLWQLFISMFTLSAFTFGGGFVIVSLMKKKFVEELKWFDENEMLDITAIAQSSPGPIPINASVIIGYRMYGLLGSLVGIIGTALPPMLIISLVSIFYKQFCSNKYISTALQVMRAGVAAVIFDVVINLAKNVCKTKRFLYIVLMIVSFICVWFFDINAMIIILFCLITGIIDALINKFMKKADTKLINNTNDTSVTHINDSCSQNDTKRGLDK